MKALYRHHKATPSLSRSETRKAKQIAEKKTRRDAKRFIATEA